MAEIIHERVQWAYEFLRTRISKTIQYKRLKSISEDPDLGVRKDWWEDVTFDCILCSARERAKRIQGGLLQDGDLIAAIKASSFQRQPGETSDPAPKLGDEVIIDGETWGLDLGGKIFLEKDPTEQIFFVGLRRSR